MGRPVSDEESDSAPEDINFQDAKDDALEQIKTVQEAAKEKKKVRKELNKRKLEVLKEQKQIKKQKLAKLESKKLPADFLNELSETASQDDNVEVTASNKKITFVEDEEDFFEENIKDSNDDFIALETDGTDFKVVTKKDLSKSKSFQASEAMSFRDKMLFGSRVRREPFQKQQMRKIKQQAGGGNVRVRASQGLSS